MYEKSVLRRREELQKVAASAAVGFSRLKSYSLQRSFKGSKLSFSFLRERS